MKLIPREDVPGYLDETYGITKTIRQIDYWRRSGKGPAYHQLEGRYYYSKEDIAEWISTSRVDPEQDNDPQTQEVPMRDRGKPAGGLCS